ncbi:MAG: hypothetical protein HYR64_07890 [Fimbriimonas ginsengisoli]|uniref:Uncharacterized protein n=1 Tax=Fimbriimonas ginsengisoli TaxID=1005039 RepID=A0A931LWB6_FIMGI|nr:hypothetical protein [Fimbriimonas ginsengisoli]
MALSLLTAFAFAQLPPTLTFSGASSTVSIQLKNVVYDPGVTAGHALSGKGDLVFSLGGGNDFTGAAMPFNGIFADSSGNVDTGKTGYTFNKDLVWNNALSLGMTLTIKSGFTILAETGSGGNKVTTTGDVSCQMPFRDDTGGQATFTASKAKLVVQGGPQVTFDTLLTASGSGKLAVAGFGISMKTPRITVQTPAKPAFKLSSDEISVATPIPSLFSDGPLTLTAKNFAIDETGLPNFDTLTLGSGQASTDPLAAAEETANPRISLLTPANFGLELTGVGGSVKQGKFHDLHLEGNLVFPDEIKNADAPTEAAEIPIQFDLADPTFKRKGSGPVKLLWQPTKDGPTLLLTVTSFTLDMAKGLRDLKASLQIKGDERFTSGGGTEDVTLAADGVSVDGNGVSGTVSLQAAIKIYGLTCNKGSLTFDRDNITGGSFFGTINLPGVGPLGVGVGVSDTGMSLVVQPSQGLSWAGFGKLNIKQGSGSVKNKLVTFNVSGDLSLEVLKDVDLAFDDLQIDSSGHIAVDELALTKPVEIPLGPLTLHANKLVYKASPESFRIDGDVKFPDSLPVTGEVGFEGLTISTAAPKISVGMVTFKAAVAGIGSIGGWIKAKGDLPDQGLTNAMGGEVDLALQCLGGAGMKGFFLIADHAAWIFGGELDLPPPGIPIPPPSPSSAPVLFITGFEGAVGHGLTVRPPSEHFPPPSEDNRFTKYKFQADNWLIEAGLQLTSTDQFLAWGLVALDLTLPQFTLSLSGDLSILTPRPMGPDPNRRLRFAMGYYGNEFDLYGDLLFKVPLYELTGKVEGKFSTSRAYLYAGWPIHENGFTNTIGLPGVVAAQSKVGVGLDFIPTPVTLQAGLEQSVKLLIVEGRRWINIKFGTDLATTKLGLAVGIEGSVDFGIVTLSASAEASGELDYRIGELPHGHLDGEFTASIDTWLGDVSVSVGGRVLEW